MDKHKFANIPAFPSVTPRDIGHQMTMTANKSRPFSAIYPPSQHQSSNFSNAAAVAAAAAAAANNHHQVKSSSSSAFKHHHQHQHQHHQQTHHQHQGGGGGGGQGGQAGGTGKQPKVPKMRPFICPKDGCAKAFTQKGNLKRHILVQHEKQRPYPSFAGAGSGSNGSAGYHHARSIDMAGGNEGGGGGKEGKDAKIRPFGCPECGKAFTQKGNLKRHIVAQHSPFSAAKASVQSGGNQQVCTNAACCKNAAYQMSGSGGKQRKLDFKRRPFCCQEEPTCAKAFTQKANLQRHLRLKHEHLKNEFGFRCAVDGCDFICEFKSELMVHQQRTHQAMEGAFKCNFAQCKQAYKHKRNLDKHIKEVHNVIFTTAFNGQQTP